jgi:predicted Zn-dependent protease
MSETVGKQRLRGLRFAAAVALALLAAGCAADRSSTAPLIPSSAPRILGAEGGYDRERGRLLAVFGGEYRAPAARAVLDDVVARLVAQSAEPGRSYRVTILNSPSPNAFALPSGDIFVTRGLLALAGDTSEVAAVLAHEIAHVTARHALQRAELERRSAIVEQVVADVLEDQAAGELIAMRNRAGIAGFSRAQELEADEIGVTTAAKAGFDPFGAVRFLEALGRDAALRTPSGGDRRRPGMNFLSSHPTTPERIARASAVARSTAAQIGRERSEDRARWLAAIDGIIYGDDSQAGLIRDRRFIHPTLGFTFTSPEGTVLENSPAAVIGMNAEAGTALRFDSLTGTSSPEEALRSSWIEGVSLGAVEVLEINGLPAATAIAAGTDWTFRMAAIRHGGVLYRFIFAARRFGPEIDRQFMTSLRSFRSMTSEEATRVRPLVLRTVEARPGDTAAGFASMMATERPTERFLALNGAVSPMLEAGRRYKIVTE